MQLSILIIVSLFSTCYCQRGLENIERGVQQVLQILKERERLDQQRENEKLEATADRLKLDSTLKKIEQQTADIARQLRTATGRSGAVTGEVQNLEIRIDSLEDNVVSNVKGGLRKMDDVQRQNDVIKAEMEKRLGKIINIISEVHDKVSKSAKNTKNDEEDEENLEATFMSAQMDALESKVKEFFSVNEQKLMSEIRKIKSELLEPFLECKDLGEQVDNMKNACEGVALTETTKSGQTGVDEPGRNYLTQDITDSFMRNLTRVQREITDKFNRKLQEIEEKITQNQPPKLQVYNSTYQTATADTVLVPVLTSTDYLQTTTTTTTTTPTTTTPSFRSGEEKKDTPDCKLKYEVPKPHSCYDLKLAGASCDGPYILFPRGLKAVYSYCDMTTNGGGWTVLMRRGHFNNSQIINFDQNWRAYKIGFGNISGEFWLGNENIRMLTSGQETMTLEVKLEAFDGSEITVAYEQFWIESEENGYKLHLGSSPVSQAYLGSSLKHHDGQSFTTYDKNNNEPGRDNCAIRYRGGWWYNRCHFALLTAPYYQQNQFRHKSQGMQWNSWKGNEALKAAEMRIRPKIYY